MRWERTAATKQDNETGHRVVAVRVGDAWRYVAWGPLDQPELSHWKWTMSVNQRITSAVGQQLKQRRALLAVSDTAAEARAVCEAHAGQ